MSELTLVFILLISQSLRDNSCFALLRICGPRYAPFSPLKGCGRYKRSLENTPWPEICGIRVGEYLTELPPKKQLAERLHDAVQMARARLEEKVESAKALPNPKPSRRKQA